MRVKGKLARLVALGSPLVVLVTLAFALPIGSSEIGGNGLALVKPAFAQQATAFPADEAGIAAYVNVGQNIDVSKTKSALRGVQAEGSNYVIGIVELPGLPEEEFPHMYISSDGWILAYYSKFAPASRIMQWYQYEGGAITTTTLQDAIYKICLALGVNFAQVKGGLGYYHFKYPEATKMLLAVDTTTKKAMEAKEDSFNFSVPYGVTLYQASWSHYANIARSYYRNSSGLEIDGEQVSSFSLDEVGTFFRWDHLLKDSYLVPEKLHTVRIRLTYDYWAGAAIVFIYR